jgi:ribosome modulation factor
MRRSKRDMLKRAFERGYQIGLSGRSRETCPPGTGPHKLSWLQGWREGRIDQWEGLTNITACYKLSGF